MVTKLLFSISLNSFILFESVKLRKICGLRKYAGKFFCEIWVVFQTVRHLFCKIYKGYESATAALFFVVAVVRYIIIGINGICVLCISIVLQLFKCRKTKKNINGNPVS